MKAATLQRAKELYEAGGGIDEIAREVGYGMRYLQRHMLYAGIVTADEHWVKAVHPGRGTKLSRAAADIKRMAGEGATAAAIAAFVGCSVVSIYHWARRNDIALVRAGKKDAKHWSTDPRAQRMVTMYRQGLTLQTIGTEFGVTRERVRQIVKKCGAVLARQKMIAGLNKAKAAQKQANTTARIFAKWGVDRELHHELRTNGTIRAWEMQRKSALLRGITWDVPFPQWYAIWQASGKLHLRGRGKGKYCMSRIKDVGGYVLGNVHIQLCTENSREAVKLWAGKTKAFPGVFCLYPGREMAWLAKVGKMSLGFFATAEEASAVREGHIAGKGYARKSNGQINRNPRIAEAA